MVTLLALSGGRPVRELPRRGAKQESGRADAFSRAGDGSGQLTSGRYVTAKLPIQSLLAARAGTCRPPGKMIGRRVIEPNGGSAMFERTGRIIVGLAAGVALAAAAPACAQQQAEASNMAR